MRVVIAEDALLTRAGIVSLLSEAGVEVVGQARDGNELIREVSTARPDAAVVDIRMPPSYTDEGLLAAASIRADFRETGVLVLSHYIEPAYAFRLLEERPEGVGYLLKDRIADIAILVDGLQRVCEGETVVDPTIVTRLLGRKRRHDPLAPLSEREREVLVLLAEGLSNRAIAGRLFITDRTVEAHNKAIFDKLGLAESPEHHRRVLAVLTFLRGSGTG